MKKNKEVEVRLEDLGKQLLEEAESIEMDTVETEIQKYVSRFPREKSFLLFAKEVGYHQVFIAEDKHTDSYDFSRHIREFLDESFFHEVNGEQKLMTDVRFIQDEEEVQGLSIWLGTTYFQLLPFDFGIEYVVSN